jgi:hypothetical protein
MLSTASKFRKEEEERVILDVWKRDAKKGCEEGVRILRCEEDADFRVLKKSVS